MLPERVRGLAPAQSPYPVAVSAALAAYQKEVCGKFGGGSG
jgi:hypothetical protein